MSVVCGIHDTCGLWMLGTGRTCLAFSSCTSAISVLAPPDAADRIWVNIRFTHSRGESSGSKQCMADDTHTHRHFTTGPTLPRTPSRLGASARTFLPRHLAVDSFHRRVVFGPRQERVLVQVVLLEKLPLLLDGLGASP